MRNGWSLQRIITAAGLGLLGLALLVVLLNLAHPIPEGMAARPLWVLLKMVMGAVLLASWVLLNVPQPRPPNGRFVLAVAQFGELQPEGAAWSLGGRRVAARLPPGGAARARRPDPHERAAASPAADASRGGRGSDGSP